MAYVLFNRRAHLQRLPVLCTIVCRRRQTNQTVNVTRENIAFFKEMILILYGSNESFFRRTESTEIKDVRQSGSRLGYVLCSLGLKGRVLDVNDFDFS